MVKYGDLVNQTYDSRLDYNPRTETVNAKRLGVRIIFLPSGEQNIDFTVTVYKHGKQNYPDPETILYAKIIDALNAYNDIK